MKGAEIYNSLRDRKDKDKDKLVIAIKFIDKSLELNPECSSFRYNRGLIYMEFEEFQKAIECFDRAISLNPENYDAYFKKVTALVSYGKISEANDFFQHTMEDAAPIVAYKRFVLEAEDLKNLPWYSLPKDGNIDKIKDLTGGSYNFFELAKKIKDLDYTVTASLPWNIAKKALKRAGNENLKDSFYDYVTSFCICEALKALGRKDEIGIFENEIDPIRLAEMHYIFPGYAHYDWRYLL